MTQADSQDVAALAVGSAFAGLAIVGVYTSQEGAAFASATARRGRSVLQPVKRPAVCLFAPRVIAQLLIAGGPAPREASMSVPRTTALEGESVGLAARPLGLDGSVIYAADVDAVTLRIYRLDGQGDVLVYEEELEPTEVMYAALQLDGYWSVDEDGYTLRYVLPREAPQLASGRMYRLEFTLDTSAHGLIAVDGVVAVRARSSTP